jgi:hypothetical protein
MIVPLFVNGLSNIPWKLLNRGVQCAQANAQRVVATHLEKYLLFSKVINILRLRGCLYPLIPYKVVNNLCNIF